MTGTRTSGAMSGAISSSGFSISRVVYLLRFGSRKTPARCQRRSRSRTPGIRLGRAEAIFIAGGDQAKYVKRWKDTPLEDAINEAVARGVPIGGTSAGLAVLCGRPFTAERGTITSDEALMDPRGDSVTLGSGFLAIPHMRYTVTDSHFHERDRMGRLVAFVANVAQESTPARGIGVDEGTAVLVGPDGQATVVGPGAAYMLASPGPPQSCEPRVPLRYHSVPVTRAHAGDTFDLSSWTGPPSARYTLTAHDGKVESSQAGGGVY